jgi:hypothetical protein
MVLSKTMASSTAVGSLPAINVAVPVSITGLTVDPIIGAAVAVGLAAGALWRVGDMLAEKSTWAEMKSDLSVSLLTGLMNAIVAMAIIDWLQAGALMALGVAAVVGASGTQAVKWVLAAVKDKIKSAGK